MISTVNEPEVMGKHCGHVVSHFERNLMSISGCDLLFLSDHSIDISMAVPFVHNWGIPGINIPVPPTRVGPAQNAPALRSLRFSPLGLYDLRRRLGVFPTEPRI